MEIISQHFKVSTSHFCSYFFDHYLTFLKKKYVYSNQIVGFTTQKNKLISTMIRVLEKNGIIFTICFDHLLILLAFVSFPVVYFLLTGNSGKCWFNYLKTSIKKDTLSFSIFHWKKKDFINHFAVEDGWSAAMMGDDFVSDDLIENKVARNFINNSKDFEGKQRASDYIPLSNITTWISNVEKDAFTQSDVDDFLDSDVEADSYLPASFDSN